MLVRQDGERERTCQCSWEREANGERWVREEIKKKADMKKKTESRDEKEAVYVYLSPGYFTARQPLCVPSQASQRANLNHTGMTVPI